jgi:hypothetical protein
MRLHVEEHDVIIVHDPQPLALRRHVAHSRAPWFWECHVDVSAPHPPIWAYLREIIEYDFLGPALLNFEWQANHEGAALQCTAALAARTIYGVHDGR